MPQLGGATRRPITDIDNINSISTGIKSGGLLRVNPLDNTKVDISSGTGIYIDNFSSPERVADPLIIQVEWDDFIGITPDFLNTQTTTAFGIDKDGNLVQKAVTFTTEDFRDTILIGVAVHLDLATIRNVDNRTIVAINAPLSLNDVAEAIRAINLEDNEFSPNGANLKLNKSSGVVHLLGAFWKVNKKVPNQGSVPFISEVDFVYTWQDGASGFNVSALTDLVVTDRYDDGTGGIGSPNGIVPTGSWSVQKIFYVGDTDPDLEVSSTIIHYGTFYYDSKIEAFNNIRESFLFNPAADGLQFRGYLIVRSGATALNDDSEAMFVTLDRFGSSIKSVSSIVRSGHISCAISLPQEIPAGAGWTDILWDVETNDKHNFTHSTSVNKELFTADTDMVVTISAQTMWESVPNSNYRIRIFKNGVDVVAEGGDDSGSISSAIDSDVTISNVRLLKGDTIKIQVRHDALVALDIMVEGSYVSIQQNI